MLRLYVRYLFSGIVEKVHYLLDTKKAAIN